MMLRNKHTVIGLPLIQYKLWAIIIAFSCCMAHSVVLAEQEQVAEEKPAGAVPPGPRQVTTIEHLSFPPTFARKSETTLDPTKLGKLGLDPVEVARMTWKGYVTKQPNVWDNPDPEGEDGLRYHFWGAVLAWPYLKHSWLDGLDVGARTVGVHAELNEILGAEKKNDPVEAGTMAYLKYLRDTDCGFIKGDPGGIPQPQGMICRNLRMLYEATGNEYYRDWSLQILGCGEKLFSKYEIDGMPLAAVGGGQGSLSGGQQCYQAGWWQRAFSEWHETDPSVGSLDMAIRLGNRVCNTEGDYLDGVFRPDGSFGAGGSAHQWTYHVHTHTYVVPGLAHLGVQLIKDGQRDKGLAFVTRARNILDFLYDPARNADAGSWTGWLPEWLHLTMGWAGLPDCEGCNTGDALEIVAAVAEAGYADPSLAELVDYYDMLERFFTGQLIEGTFQITPAYKKTLKERVKEQWGDQWEPHYKQYLIDAERFVGQHLGGCGFPDKINNLLHWPAEPKPDNTTPGIVMAGCCSRATIDAVYAVWKHIVTGDASCARVNMAINHDCDLLKVISSLPKQGEINVLVKTASKVLLRVPTWAPHEDTKAYMNHKKVDVNWDATGRYVTFDSVTTGDQLTVTYPLRIAKVVETVNGSEYTERWRGNTIVDISPHGQWMPMYKRQ